MIETRSQSIVLDSWSFQATTSSVACVVPIVAAI